MPDTTTSSQDPATQSTKKLPGLTLTVYGAISTCLICIAQIVFKEDKNADYLKVAVLMAPFISTILSYIFQWFIDWWVIGSTGNRSISVQAKQIERKYNLIKKSTKKEIKEVEKEMKSCSAERKTDLQRLLKSLFEKLDTYREQYLTEQSKIQIISLTESEGYAKRFNEKIGD